MIMAIGGSPLAAGLYACALLPRNSGHEYNACIIVVPRAAWLPCPGIAGDSIIFSASFDNSTLYLDCTCTAVCCLGSVC